MEHLFYGISLNFRFSFAGPKEQDKMLAELHSKVSLPLPLFSRNNQSSNLFSHWLQDCSSISSLKPFVLSETCWELKKSSSLLFSFGPVSHDWSLKPCNNSPFVCLLVCYADLRMASVIAHHFFIYGCHIKSDS